jgi:hypothetical protein
MNILETTLWTRKDIARMLGEHVSTDMVRRCEHKWGLHHARIKLKTREVMYCGQKVIVILRQAGVMN